MPTHDPDLILKRLRTESARLCFYPSCGNRSPWVVAGLDADVFVFSDNFPRNARERERFWHTFEQGFASHGMRPILEFATVKTCFFRLHDKFLFTLHSLLFKDLHDAQDSYKILRFPERQRISASSSSLPLARLLPMRQRYGCRMIANYCVEKTFEATGRVEIGRSDLSGNLIL